MNNRISSRTIAECGVVGEKGERTGRGEREDERERENFWTENYDGRGIVFNISCEMRD